MSHQQFHETVQAQEQYEEEQAERAENARQQKQDEEIDFPGRAEMDAMVKDWAEREREQAWIAFSAEMQRNIDVLNNLSIRSK